MGNTPKRAIWTALLGAAALATSGSLSTSSGLAGECEDLKSLARPDTLPVSAPGSESGPFNWGFLETPANAPNEPSFDGSFKWALGADWRWRDFDLALDMPKVDALPGPALNGAMTGELSRLQTRGGKMVIATNYVDNDPAKGGAMQRPPRLYPQAAWHNGDGDPNDAANFVCATEKK
jgi:hypothetical protein